LVIARVAPARPHPFCSGVLGGHRRFCVCWSLTAVSWWKTAPLGPTGSTPTWGSSDPATTRSFRLFGNLGGVGNPSSV